MEDQIDIVVRMSMLTKRALRDEITDEELNELREWLSQDDNRNTYWAALFANKELGRYSEIIRDNVSPHPNHGMYASYINRNFKIVRTLLPWVAVGAIFVGFVIYIRKDHIRKTPPMVAATQSNNIIPGSSKAILTLGGGSQISLSGNEDTSIIISSATIIQNAGSSRYMLSGKNLSPEYNILETPRGGQWHVVLPDGSEVWLNSASSIRYPTAFQGSAREVAVTGEAFFQIRNSPSAPFIVKAPRTTVRVLGTSFNIKTSSADSIEKTTLLAGQVEISAGSRSVKLQPGHQAAISAHQLITSPADTATVTAWKEGIFLYDQASLQNVMEDIENWYDVDVIFTKDFDTMPRFSGMVDRNTALTKFLEMISETKIAAFKIEGRTITVKRSQ